MGRRSGEHHYWPPYRLRGLHLPPGGKWKGCESDWFGDNVARKVINGASTFFWLDTWIGSQPLCVLFPRLFLVLDRYEGWGADFGSWVNGVWLLVLERISTRANLHRHRVILDPSLVSYVICGASMQSSLHLFMRCHFANRVWYAVFTWLGWQLPLPPDIFFLLSALCAFGWGLEKSRVWVLFGIQFYGFCGRCLKNMYFPS